LSLIFSLLDDGVFQAAKAIVYSTGEEFIEEAQCPYDGG
jgi:hypothetical protein